MEVGIVDLWQPILLGTFLAWIASAVIHMGLKYHNRDYKKLVNEDEIRDAVRGANAELGIHCIPYCVDMKDMADESMQKKFEEGPIAFVTIFPNGMPAMGKLVGQQVIYFLFGCSLVAYVATMGLQRGADYLDVFQFVCPLSFGTFGWALIPMSIWYGHPWAVTARYLLDAAIYGAIVAGGFAWLWPAAV